jgi:hypothetical protein
MLPSLYYDKYGKSINNWNIILIFGKTLFHVNKLSL